MKFEGGCYCGNVRYEAEGDPVVKALCCCRECQYISGGGQNVTMGMPEGGFKYTKGTPQAFKRADLENGVVREFCGDCGTHFGARPPSLPGVFMLKVGTMDDPGLFEAPQMVIYACDKQAFHHVPEGAMVFERVPG